MQKPVEGKRPEKAGRIAKPDFSLRRPLSDFTIIDGELTLNPVASYGDNNNGPSYTYHEIKRLVEERNSKYASADKPEEEKKPVRTFGSRIGEVRNPIATYVDDFPGEKKTRKKKTKD